MFQITQSPHVCRVSTEHLQVEFRWQHDRWEHDISVPLRRGAIPVVSPTAAQVDTAGEDRSPGWLPLLTSVEGTPNLAVLPSPAFQDLRLEQLASDVCEIQLMGQSGKSVYSAAIRFDGRGASLDFDVSVRAQQQSAPVPASSTYSVSMQANIEPVGASNSTTGAQTLAPTILQSAGLLVQYGRRNLELSPVQLAGQLPCGWMPAVHPARQNCIQIGALEAIPAQHLEHAITQRWRYQVKCVTNRESA